MRDSLAALVLAVGAGCSAAVVLLIRPGPIDVTLWYLGWAVTPYAVSSALLAAWRKWLGNPQSRRVLAWSAAGIATVGPAFYVDAVLIRPDAQGAFVLFVVPALQVALSMLSVAIAAVCDGNAPRRVLRSAKRLRASLRQVAPGDRSSSEPATTVGPPVDVARATTQTTIDTRPMPFTPGRSGRGRMVSDRRAEPPSPR